MWIPAHALIGEALDEIDIQPAALASEQQKRIGPISVLFRSLRNSLGWNAPCLEPALLLLRKAMYAEHRIG